jgi:TPR repeat protein
MRWPIMSDEASTSTPSVSCSHCGQALEHQPRHAPFCPFCGHRLARVPIAARYRSLRHALSRRLFSCLQPMFQRELDAAVPMPAGPEEQRGPSLVVLGYSAALYRLGWRYEHAIGVSRNLDEAHRCYGKSARLGYENAVNELSRMSTNEEER